MAKILIKSEDFKLFDFESEKEFESAVIKNSKVLFGSEAVYLDFKSRIGESGSYHKGIPDGYLVDFSNQKEPELYFIENELASHDVYGHITEQVARFYSSYISSPNQLRDKLIAFVKTNPPILKEVSELVKNSPFENIDALFNYVTNKEIKVVIVINEITTDLNLGLKIFRQTPDVVLLQRYMHKGEVAFYYEPLRDDLEDVEVGKKNKKPFSNRAKVFDTVVCAAFEEGFKHAYVKNSAWWAIRLSQEAREKLKYLAIYEKSPVAEIKHVAEIERIEPYKDSGKFIVYLKNRQDIKPIKLDKANSAPQSPRFTTFDKLKNTHKISELW